MDVRVKGYGAGANEPQNHTKWGEAHKIKKRHIHNHEAHEDHEEIDYKKIDLEKRMLSY